MGHTYLNKVKPAVYLCVAALGIMYAALYNGYPLVTPDSGAYIDIAMHPYMPVDRPPFYSIFLRVSSLCTSLWFTVFVQSALLAFLLYRLSLKIYGTNAPLKVYVTGFIIIISFTCVSWVSSFLMADAFTPVLFLSIILFLNTRARSSSAVLYLFIIAGSIITHNSHFIIAIAFSLLLLAAGLIKGEKELIAKAATILGIAVLCYIMVCSLNYRRYKEFVLSKGGHVFIMGKLAETGILNTYLDDNCKTKNYKLCAYKNDIPIVSFVFLWSPNSPFYKTGGWDSSKQEYDSIIHGVLTTPKYLGMFAMKSAISTMRQVTQVNIPDRPMIQSIPSSPYSTIHNYFPVEEKEYLWSKQNQNVMEAGMLNVIYDLFFICSSIFVFWYLPGTEDKKKITSLYAILILLIVVNAFTTATFSTVQDRLQNRVFWLLPALNAMLLVRFMHEKVKMKNR